MHTFNSAILYFTQVNFVGKLLGPQGNTIKRLQEETGAKISVLGKGSMRDKNKVGRVLLAAFLQDSCPTVLQWLQSCMLIIICFRGSSGRRTEKGWRSQICSPSHGAARVYRGNGTHPRGLSSYGSCHGRGQEVPHPGKRSREPLVSQFE